MPYIKKELMENSLDAFNYRAFILRCWQESIPRAGIDCSWRFSLIHFDGLQTEKGFASLEDLVKYLQTELTKRNRQEIKD